MKKIQYLLPGHFLIVKDREGIVETVLGSCVCVILQSRDHSVAGLCHSLLPSAPDIADADMSPPATFINRALPLLLEKLRAEGYEPGDLTAGLFGGGRVISLQIPRHDVAHANIRAAHNWLSYHGISITAQDTGSDVVRKVVYNAATGQTISSWLPGEARAS